MSLEEKFEQLEDILVRQRDSLADHAGVPFIVLVYNPEDELKCREEISNLNTHLKEHKLSTHEILLEKFLIEYLERNQLADDVLQLERENEGKVISENSLIKEINELYVKEFPSFVLSEINSHNSEIFFLTRVGSIHPFYRVSSLLSHLETKVSAPTIIFYPGKMIDEKLFFLGKYESDNYYRARLL